MTTPARPSGAFVGASWVALLSGSVAFLAGLWNSNMQLNEKGYYLTLLLYGLFAAVSCKSPCATGWKASKSRICISACAGSPSVPPCC